MDETTERAEVSPNTSHQQGRTRVARKSSATHCRRVPTNELRYEHEDTSRSDFQTRIAQAELCGLKVH